VEGYIGRLLPSEEPGPLPGEPGEAGDIERTVADCERAECTCGCSRKDEMIAASADERARWYEGWPDEVAVAGKEPVESSRWSREVGLWVAVVAEDGSDLLR
jgi:hypothetical protein